MMSELNDRLQRSRWLLTAIDEYRITDWTITRASLLITVEGRLSGMWAYYSRSFNSMSWHLLDDRGNFKRRVEHGSFCILNELVSEHVHLVTFLENNPGSYKWGDLLEHLKDDQEFG